MLSIAKKNREAAYKIDNKFVMLIYLDPSYLTPSEWGGILSVARDSLGEDFYVIGTTENPSYFEYFDALCPWVNLEQWDIAKGSNVYDRAIQWVSSEHANLYGNVERYPGRVVFGGVAPGFDDYTKNWGECRTREIPRDPLLLQAQFDYLYSKSAKAVVLQTWDDWTEGTEFEPDVTSGPSELVHVRQLLRKLYGEPQNVTGDIVLEKRWLEYGQARNCEGGKHGTPPFINLRC
eukprot:TRINITY_DN3779_c0_g1_i1.p1 TRINITY_DN3779_c0_g1~~TRINITY_DN3779_c0_g1_i1.p1  ORF type:complete len:234 (-),score=37.56 TRINITY_DN3779_c0_g1_i1:40-741(-)